MGRLGRAQHAQYTRFLPHTSQEGNKCTTTQEKLRGYCPNIYTVMVCLKLLSSALLIDLQRAPPLNSAHPAYLPPIQGVQWKISVFFLKLSVTKSRQGAKEYETVNDFTYFCTKCPWFSKGGLISEISSLYFKSLKMGAKSLSWALST